MEKSLFKFIWKYSKKEQLVQLLITLLIFPVLFVSLELPKRIINDAIGGNGENTTIFWFSFTQVQFLTFLCAGFLLAAVTNLILTIRLNTMKGVLAEQLLRRLRYQLLNRILQFPRSYFQSTSQGELVSMVTSEAEPMSKVMGDILSQPILLIGQILTILTFLFSQSFWFGIAAIALIPFQGYFIPKMQRKINLLNKNLTQEARNLSASIGETAAAVSDIRINGGTRYRMSMFSMCLGKLYDMRFDRYQKKFFMKFTNTIINQLTRFFFYSFGGYLAIQGHISIGSLVAALAAYKDMSLPWKDLQAFYNETQDMAIKWDILIERFEAKPLIDKNLLEGSPSEIKNLKGDIVIHNATFRDESGSSVLENINLTIPQGSCVAIKVCDEVTALAFADLLTREIIPQSGSIKIAGHDLNTIHQVTLANCIGYAHSNPEILKGTLGQNLLLPFKNQPLESMSNNSKFDSFKIRANKSGNSPDPFNTEWVDPSIAGLKSLESIQNWWFELLKAMGIDDFMVRRALSAQLNISNQQELADAIVQLRPEIAKRISKAGLKDVVHHFDPDKFNPVSLLGSNLLYALPTSLLSQKSLAENKNFVKILREQGISSELVEMSSSLITNVIETFGSDGINHPLFRRLNLDEELYQRLGTIVKKRRELGDTGLSQIDYALMLTVPFIFSAEQFGPAFDDTFKKRLLQIRKQSSVQMIRKLDGLFETIDPKKYYSVMTVMENAIFGKISSTAGTRKLMVENIIVDVLNENGLQRLAAQTIYDLDTSLCGTNLPAVFKERIAFSRAGIKKPDILILKNSLASHDAEARELMKERITNLLPDTTKIFIERKIDNPEDYDLSVEINGGRIDGEPHPEVLQNINARQDLNKKIKAIAKTELFGKLNRKQQRLLAFGAQWYKAEAGRKIFSAGEDADAVYLCINGSAGLYWPENDGKMELVSEFMPGQLIGELSVIKGKKRYLTLVTIKDCMFLRIAATDLMTITENDGVAASNLMRSVADNLLSTIDTLHVVRSYAMNRGVDFSDFDEGKR